MPSSLSSAASAPFLPAYRPDIDGLRAVAILLVVIYHAFPLPLRGGFVGVDIFFVISGYLISSIIFKNLAQGSFSFFDFYAHRVRRIFPALIVVLSGCLAFGWFSLMAVEFMQLGKHAAGGAGFIDNILLWTENGYFDTASEQKPLMHLWSLGIEEQFYLLFPVLCCILWRLRANLGIAITLLAAISFAWNIVATQADSVAAFFLPQTRFWELLAGSALAYVSVFPPTSPFRRAAATLLTRRGIRNLAAATGLLLIIAAAFIVHKNKAFPGWWAIMPVLGASLLIAAGPQAWCNSKLLATQPMIFVGSISYPLYLWHWPLLSFARIVDSELPPTPVRLALVVASFILAWLTFRLIESPIRFRSRPPSWTASLSAAVAVVGLAGFGIHWQDGLPERPVHRLYAPHFEQVGAASLLERLAQLPECSPAELRTQTARCRQTANRSDTTPGIAIVGDSHAEHLFSGFAEALAGKQSLLYLTNPCYPFFGLVANDSCRGNDLALAYILARPEIHTVVLANFWSYRLKENLIRLADQVQENNGEVIFSQALEATLSRLRASGKRIIFAHDIPDLDFEATACLPPRPFALTLRDTGECTFTNDKTFARAKAYRAASERVLSRHPDVVRWDPFAYFCDAQYCRASRSGVLLYRDRNHLSLAGSRWLAERLLADDPVLRQYMRPQ